MALSVSASQMFCRGGAESSNRTGIGICGDGEGHGIDRVIARDREIG